MYALDLACHDTVYTEVAIKKQYPDDTHWVLCPHCQDVKQHVDSLVIASVPTAWQKVLVERPLDDIKVYHVYRRSPQFVYGDRILRLQPSVPPNRISPFPYKTRRTGFRIS